VNDPIVGIDLGTSNTVVAHADATGKVTVLADESGYKIHPSVVSFHPSGGVVVGAPAKQRKVIDPKNTIFSVKRLVGRTYGSPEVQTAKTRMPYEIKEGTNEQPMIVTRAGEFAVPEISAIVLDHAKNVAAARLPSVGRAVVTVPASFNDAQRSATATAGAIAGLTVVRVLNEPTAAALAYGHARNLNEVIAVYDFGGGTFDITILKLADQVYEVLGTAGDTFLGGDDLDERLVDRMVAKFLSENRIDLRSNEVSMMRLRAVAEQTKIELSRRSRAVVRIDEIAYGPNGKPLDLHIEITRDEFVREVADIIDRTFPVCQEALSLAMLDITGISDVILVGGTTKIPYVRDQVSRFFGRAPRTDVNPEDAVAMGAALQATSLERILTRKSRPASAVEDTQTNPAYETPVEQTNEGLDFDGATTTDPVPRKRITAGYEQVARNERHGERPVTRGETIDRIDERPTPPPTGAPLARMTRTGMPAVKAPPPPPRTERGMQPIRAATPVAGTPQVLPAAAPQIPSAGTPQVPPAAAPQIPPAGTPAAAAARTLLADASARHQPPRTDRGMQPVRSAPPPVPPAAPNARTLMIDPGTERDPMARAGEIDRPEDPTLERHPGRIAHGGDGDTLTLEPTTPERRGALAEPPPATTMPGFGHAEQPPATTMRGQAEQPPAGAFAPTASVTPLPARLPEAPPAGMLPQTYPVMAAAPAPVVLDVTPRGLGIATVAGYCEQLIRRNSRVPTEIRKLFTTSRDRQPSVRIVVCQGESRKIGDNVVLGDLRLENLPPRLRDETSIEVTFMIDASGILQVSARDAQTGQEQRVSLDLVGAMPQADIGAARDRIQQLRR
jgi:molecular chaperone DnaK